MQDFTIESELGTEIVQAKNQWKAAGEWAAQHAGFDTDEPCWEPFSFHVNETEFAAEIYRIGRSGSGILEICSGDQRKFFNQEGNAVKLKLT